MLIYSYKEKKHHFNALRNSGSASIDLELLLKLCPDHPDKRRFTLYSGKLGDEILLSLLDFATKEEIREFRRLKSDPTPQPQLEPAPQPEIPSPGPGPVSHSESPAEGNVETDDFEQRVADAEQRASEAEERADDAELRAEEAEEKVEEAEERAEQAEQALEEEKKKERPASAKSKRKKNSPK